MKTTLVNHFSLLAALQRLGKSLMLPIAVLPIAGILLRLGAPDVFDIAFISEAGGAIFKNLALIFSVGVAVGISKDSAGAAALAGGIGYLVLTSSLKTIDESIDMGVLSGIISGISAGVLYNRFHKIVLPDWLGFFSGKRFVPIITGASLLILALLLGVIWPPIQAAIKATGFWLLESGSTGAFVYGTLNRLLIPTGLHQVLNSLVWFVFGEFNGAQGDLGRFFAGDPSAGTFMTGFYPIMLAGLPAACLAMYHCAEPDKKKQAAGLLLGVGLTSLVTGVTEPVEFMFMFLAPVLYVMHALMTGAAMAVCSYLEIKAGFTFSAGLIDFVLNAGLSTNLLYMIPMFIITFVSYYGTFAFFIRRFDLKTPGRDTVVKISESVAVQRKNTDHGTGETIQTTMAAAIKALGEAVNILSIESCITRLRLRVKDMDLVNKEALKQALGARGVITLGSECLQVVIGPKAEQICGQMEQEWQYKIAEPSNYVPEKDLSTDDPLQGLVVTAPMSGQVVNLKDVPDDVFSQKLVGDGIAIEPIDGRVVAPCDGVIEAIVKTKHAFTLRSDSGHEIIVHIGLDTVELDGSGFESHVQEGQRVRRGDLVLSVDLDYIRQKSKATLTPIVVANDDHSTIKIDQLAHVKAGCDRIFNVSV